MYDLMDVFLLIRYPPLRHKEALTIGPQLSKRDSECQMAIHLVLGTPSTS